MQSFKYINCLKILDIDQICKINDAFYRRMLGSILPSSPVSGADRPGSPEPKASFSCSTTDEKVNNIARTFLRLSHTLKIYVKYSVYVFFLLRTKNLMLYSSGHQRAFEKVNHLFETEEFGASLQVSIALYRKL